MLDSRPNALSSAAAVGGRLRRIVRTYGFIRIFEFILSNGKQYTYKQLYSKNAEVQFSLFFAGS